MKKFSGLLLILSVFFGALLYCQKPEMADAGQEQKTEQKSGDFVIVDGVLLECSSKETEIEIPEGVKGIGEKAFYHNTALKTVILPEGVEWIGDKAFDGCRALERVQLPDSLSKIGAEAFSFCSSLNDINLSKVKVMGMNAFFGARSLTCVDISSLEEAYGATFGNTGILEFAGFTHMPEMDHNAFGYSDYYYLYGKDNKENSFWIVDGVLLSGVCCKGEVYIPDTVREIAPYAFASSMITSVIIPDSVTKIGDHAFDYCLKLRTVRMENSVTELGEEVFRYCKNLKNLRLSNNISSLKYCFSYNNKLKELTLPENLKEFKYMGGAKSITISDKIENVDVTGTPTFYVTDLKQTKTSSVLKKLAKTYEFQELALDETQVTLNPSEKYVLRFNSGAKAVWTSGNKAVATVDRSGAVTAKKAGTAVITAKIYGKKYTCKVVVTNTPLNRVIAIDSAHFPDEGFRKYLSVAADTNGDGKLSVEEREAVTCIRNRKWDYDRDDAWNEANQDSADAAEKELFRLADNIRSLQGIEYFPNLYEIHLNSIEYLYELKEISISNSKLEILELSNVLWSVSKINIQCPNLRICEISQNKWMMLSPSLHNKEEEYVTHLYLKEVPKLQSLNLCQVVIASFEELAGCKQLKEAEFGVFSLNESQAAYINELTGLENLRLYIWNDTKLDELNLSGMTALKNLDLMGAFRIQKLILPNASLTPEFSYYRVDFKGYLYKEEGPVPELFAGEDRVAVKVVTPAPVTAEGEILLNEENFPDYGFRCLIREVADLDDNGILTLEERETLTVLRNNIYDREQELWNEDLEYYEVFRPQNDYDRRMFFWANCISSLEGIQYFPKLRYICLEASANRDWEFDGDDAAKQFSCIQKLRLDHLPELENVQIISPKLNQVEISNTPKLGFLYLETKSRECDINLESEVKNQLKYYNVRMPKKD